MIFLGIKPDDITFWVLSGIIGAYLSARKPDSVSDTDK